MFPATRPRPTSGRKRGAQNRGVRSVFEMPAAGEDQLTDDCRPVRGRGHARQIPARAEALFARSGEDGDEFGSFHGGSSARLGDILDGSESSLAQFFAERHLFDKN